MKCFSWNVRGLCSTTRQLSVRRWININRPLFGGLLETKVKQANLEGIINDLLPGWSFEANYSENAINGRIVVVWDPLLSVVIYFKSDQIMVCGIFDPVSSHRYTVAFVYGRNTIEARRSLWHDIGTIASATPLRAAPWLIMGDFNQVLTLSEAYSLNEADIPLSGLQDLRDCLNESGLFDLTNRGSFFTWTNKSPTNPKSRKLDRALINEQWQDVYPDSFATFDVPGGSDHSPCLVSIVSTSTRRKTRFMFFPFFTSHKDYLMLMTEAWNSAASDSNPMMKLCYKLRAAKLCCKDINQGSFSDISKRTKEAFEDLEGIQRVVMESPSVDSFEQERLARDKWLILAKAEESFFKQKSRVRWLQVGDMSTSIFFKSCISNLSRNKICFLIDDDGNRISDADQMKAMVDGYYTNLLGTSNNEVFPCSVAEIQALQPFRCPESIKPSMSAIPTPQEIKDTMFSLPRNKAPGPDGFTMEFFTSSWDLVGQDVVEAVTSFFVTGNLPRQVNTTVIALIPKTTGASRLSDFRPISLCNTIYKVISRIISARLKQITSEAVQRNQVGFVKDRLLCENVLLASELVVDFNKEGNTTQGCLQIDITKAYDNVNWIFILNILNALELPSDFINWIRVCISSPFYSIVLNGELCGFFPGKKGLRQGDAISSSLFVLAMDVLAKRLDRAVAMNRFIPHPRCINPLITHLSFADDILVFFDGNELSLAAILEILNEFKVVSGLALNQRKTSLFLNGNNMTLTSSLAASYGLTPGSLPVRYLGLPLSPSKLSPQDYQPLIDRVLARISSWTVRRISFAGRLQLIQSVLYGIINFWSAVFPLPKSCFDKLERICNAFLWSGEPNSAKGAKIAWDSVCSPKEAGGLGLRRLEGSNQVYGLKLIWLLFAAEGSLWVAWVHTHLIRGRVFWDADFSGVGSWIWRRLMKLRPLARSFISCSIVSGNECLFWHDNWTELGALIDIIGGNGPRVTGISYLARVSAACSDQGWLLPRGRHPITLLLKSCLPDQPPVLDSLSKDIYLWKNNPNDSPGTFSSLKTWKSLNPVNITVPWHKSVWFTGRVPKHAFHMWVIAWDRLLTRDRLRGWGIVVPPTCLLCSADHESRSHIYFDCSFSRDVWFSLFDPRFISPPDSIEEVLQWVRNCSTSSKIKTIVHIIFHAASYFLWQERNVRLHSAVTRSAGALVKIIQLNIRAKLIGIDRDFKLSAQFQRGNDPTSSQSFISLWFENFQTG